MDQTDQEIFDAIQRLDDRLDGTSFDDEAERHVRGAMESIADQLAAQKFASVVHGLSLGNTGAAMAFLWSGDLWYVTVFLITSQFCLLLGILLSRLADSHRYFAKWYTNHLEELLQDYRNSLG